MTDYQLFDRSQPTMKADWSWRADPDTNIMIAAALALGLPTLGWLILALPVWIVDWFFDLNWGAVMHILWIGLLTLGAIAIVVGAALIVYRFTTMPTYRAQRRAEYEQAVFAWQYARAEHIARWAHHNGWH